MEAKVAVWISSSIHIAFPTKYIWEPTRMGSSNQQLYKLAIVFIFADYLTPES